MNNSNDWWARKKKVWKMVSVINLNFFFSACLIYPSDFIVIPGKEYISGSTPSHDSKRFDSFYDHVSGFCPWCLLDNDCSFTFLPNSSALLLAHKIFIDECFWQCGPQLSKSAFAFDFNFILWFFRTWILKLEWRWYVPLATFNKENKKKVWMDNN